MPNLKLGVLSDMPDIRKKACLKLFKQQVWLSFCIASLCTSTFANVAPHSYLNAGECRIDLSDFFAFRI